MSTPAAGEVPTRVVLVGVRPLFDEDIFSYVFPASVVEIVGEADDEGGAINIVEKTRPDVIVVAASSEPLPIHDMMKRRPFAGRPKDDLHVGRSILKRWPSAKVIALSNHADFELGDYARRSGFRGCVSLEGGLADVQRAIPAVAKGDLFFPEKGFSV
jgi:DNA-binding NarL/FixJ family response regulator